MARARTALAPTGFQGIRLCRALLFSDSSQSILYRAAYSHSGSLSAYQLALVVAQSCKVSEPTARRAISRMRRLGLLEGGGREFKFMPVLPTPLARMVFDGGLNE